MQNTYLTEIIYDPDTPENALRNALVFMRKSEGALKRKYMITMYQCRDQYRRK